MSYRPRYDKGDWLAVCDSCGRYFKGSALRKRWDGLMVCSSDWETRQPQDFVRGVVEKQIPPWTRSKTTDTMVNIAPSGAIVGYAIAGLSRVGWGHVVDPVPPSTFTL